MVKNHLTFNKAMFFLFVLAILIVLKAILAPKLSLEDEASIVIDKLTNSYEETSFMESGLLIEEKLRVLDNMDYNEVKSMLGVKNDFCIYLEDTTGNIVKIDDISQGIGSDKISINGEACR